MKKHLIMKLLICIIFIAILFNLCTNSPTYASEIGSIFEDGKEFLTEGKPINKTIKTNKLIETSNYIYNILLALGIVVAIIVGMVLGIQFMIAGADEKAKVKEALIPYIIGCVVVVGAFTIWKIVINIGNKTESSVTMDSGEFYCPYCGFKSDWASGCLVCDEGDTWR